MSTVEFIIPDPEGHLGRFLHVGQESIDLVGSRAELRVTASGDPYDLKRMRADLESIGGHRGRIAAPKRAT